MSRWDEARKDLAERPRTWLVTGAAGFIGSHLVEELLGLGQHVVGLDDFSTGSRANLADVEARVGADAWRRFRLREGDVRDPGVCRAACAGVELVLHQAALGSVPRSIADPLTSHAVNVDGFLNVLEAARVAGCARVVYASSSSVYGDHPGLPKREGELGRPLSPYAATKRADELYAAAFAAAYDLSSVGLRYFNVFGPRQDPAGPYAAVIPRWVRALVAGDVPVIHGDGETSRDFCPVANVVQANLLAALVPCELGGEHAGEAFNVALGRRTTLAELFLLLRDGLARRGVPCGEVEAAHDDFRAGDVRHSHADLARVRAALGYAPAVDLERGIELTLDAALASCAPAASP